MEDSTQKALEKLRKFSRAVYNNSIQPHTWKTFKYIKFPKIALLFLLQ